MCQTVLGHWNGIICADKKLFEFFQKYKTCQKAGSSKGQISAAEAPTARGLLAVLNNVTKNER
jgi:hypothetical protein